MKTSPTLHINRQSHHFDINVRAVWGAIATWNGQSHLNEFLATVDLQGCTSAHSMKLKMTLMYGGMVCYKMT